MKKKLLSLVLALALCLGLAVPAFAAGTKEVVVDEKHGVTITMDEFLRTETHRYAYDSNGNYITMTFYVVADNSTVTIEAMEGRRYAEEGEDWDYQNPGDCAYRDSSGYMWFGGEDGNYFRGGQIQGIELLTGPAIVTMTPLEGERFGVTNLYSIHFVCESNFAKLVPFEGKPNAADWAQETLENAYDAGLFPNTINPFKEDCTRGMTRAEFAAVTVNLYAAMLGKDVWELGVSYSSPFTDAEYDYSVGFAYNLGFVKGTSETTFSPDTTLTREQAAVMLARVYTKIHGDIPAVAATSFGDDASVSDWAKDAVAFMADKGIVNGVGDNKFAPQNTLSIQEAVAMAQRMLENLK